MPRLMISPAMHLAQLEQAWPEFQLSFNPDTGMFTAVLRADPETGLAAEHLGALEQQLLAWDKERQQ